jgi:CBS domain-containing protein
MGKTNQSSLFERNLMNATLTISDCMKKNVISISAKASISEAAAMLTRYHIGSLPVVDDAGHLVGLLQLRDLLALVLPDFIRLVEDFDFVADFGAIENRKPDQASLQIPVIKVMQPPISVDENCGLLRAFSVLKQENIHDLPIVDTSRHLIGIASRVDIGTLLLSTWNTTLPGKS